jgi:hypothetical protein
VGLVEHRSQEYRDFVFGHDDRNGGGIAWLERKTPDTPSRPLPPTTLRQYHVRAERRLDALVVMPTAHPAGRELQAAVKAWRTKFFVFLEDPDVPPTNNACEREVRPSVVFSKVTGGFRSPWGTQIHAGSLRHRHRPAPRRTAGHRSAPQQDLRANTGDLKPAR